MKILILIDAWFPFTGGAQIQIKNLKKILEKSSKGRPVSNRKYKCEFFLFHSPSANIFIRFLWSFWVIPQIIFFQLSQYLKDGRPLKIDLIHAHAYWPGIPGKILSRILKIPIIFTVHGSNLLDLGVKSPRAFLEKIILTKIKYDQVISVSSNFLKYKNVNQNIVIISNGVDVKEFRIQNSEFRIKDKNLRILSVGRDDPVKGLKYLKKAMVKVKKEFPKIELKIINKGYKHADLVKEYLKADVFVLASLSEGQPLTLLEAWAAKLPVVVTEVGDNPKMVKNGVNGYLVKPKDSNSLAKAIIKVLQSKTRGLMGEKGYQLVKKNYTWEKCAQKTWETYQKVLKNE